jgi:hypothetical protein
VENRKHDGTTLLIYVYACPTEEEKQQQAQAEPSDMISNRQQDSSGDFESEWSCGQMIMHGGFGQNWPMGASM